VEEQLPVQQAVENAAKAAFAAVVAVVNSVIEQKINNNVQFSSEQKQEKENLVKELENDVVQVIQSEAYAAAAVSSVAQDAVAAPAVPLVNGQPVAAPAVLVVNGQPVAAPAVPVVNGQPVAAPAVPVVNGQPVAAPAVPLVNGQPVAAPAVPVVNGQPVAAPAVPVVNGQLVAAPAVPVVNGQLVAAPAVPVVNGQLVAAPAVPLVNGQPVAAPAVPVVNGQPVAAPAVPVVNGQPVAAPAVPVVNGQPVAAPAVPVVNGQPAPVTEKSNTTTKKTVAAISTFFSQVATGLTSLFTKKKQEIQNNPQLTEEEKQEQLQIVSSVQEKTEKRLEEVTQQQVEQAANGSKNLPKNAKEITIFNKTMQLEDPSSLRKNAKKKLTENQINVLKEFGLEGDGVTREEKIQILEALYSGTGCDTSKPLILLEQCEPIRRILQSLALNLLGRLEPINAQKKKNVNALKGVKKPIVSVEKATDGTTKVCLSFGPDQVGTLSEGEAKSEEEKKEEEKEEKQKEVTAKDATLITTVGIDNKGNFCYCTSTVQMLFSIPEVRDTILSLECEDKDPPSGDITFTAPTDEDINTKKTQVISEMSQEIKQSFLCSLQFVFKKLIEKTGYIQDLSSISGSATDVKDQMNYMMKVFVAYDKAVYGNKNIVNSNTKQDQVAFLEMVFLLFHADERTKSLTTLFEYNETAVKNNKSNVTGTKNVIYVSLGDGEENTTKKVSLQSLLQSKFNNAPIQINQNEYLLIRTQRTGKDKSFKDFNLLAESSLGIDGFTYHIYGAILSSEGHYKYLRIQYKDKVDNADDLPRIEYDDAAVRMNSTNADRWTIQKNGYLLVYKVESNILKELGLSRKDLTKEKFHQEFNRHFQGEVIPKSALNQRDNILLGLPSSAAPAPGEGGPEEKEKEKEEQTPSEDQAITEELERLENGTEKVVNSSTQTNAEKTSELENLKASLTTIQTTLDEKQKLLEQQEAELATLRSQQASPDAIQKAETALITQKKEQLADMDRSIEVFRSMIEKIDPTNVNVTNVTLLFLNNTDTGSMDTKLGAAKITLSGLEGKVKTLLSKKMVNVAKDQHSGAAKMLGQAEAKQQASQDRVQKLESKMLDLETQAKTNRNARVQVEEARTQIQKEKEAAEAAKQQADTLREQAELAQRELQATQSRLIETHKESLVQLQNGVQEANQKAEQAERSEKEAWNEVRRREQAIEAIKANLQGKVAGEAAEGQLKVQELEAQLQSEKDKLTSANDLLTSRKKEADTAIALAKASEVSAKEELKQSRDAHAAELKKLNEEIVAKEGVIASAQAEGQASATATMELQALVKEKETTLESLQSEKTAADKLYADEIKRLSGLIGQKETSIKTLKKEYRKIASENMEFRININRATRQVKEAENKLKQLETSSKQAVESEKATILQQMEQVKGELTQAQQQHDELQQQYNASESEKNRVLEEKDNEVNALKAAASERVEALQQQLAEKGIQMEQANHTLEDLKDLLKSQRTNLVKEREGRAINRGSLAVSQAEIAALQQQVQEQQNMINNYANEKSHIVRILEEIKKEEDVRKRAREQMPLPESWIPQEKGQSPPVPENNRKQLQDMEKRMTRVKKQLNEASGWLKNYKALANLNATRKNQKGGTANIKGYINSVQSLEQRYTKTQKNLTNYVNRKYNNNNTKKHNRETIYSAIDQLNDDVEKVHDEIMSTQFAKKNKEIVQLREDLQKVMLLLQQNKKTVIPEGIDYNDCKASVEKLKQIHSIFERKKQVISILDTIIPNLDTNAQFKELSVETRQSIKDQYKTTKENLETYMVELDLEKYVTNPIISSLSNQSKKKNSAMLIEYCKSLQTPLDYWDEHVSEFREQDTILTNIYEDISGAVRVYIKIKPLIGGQQQSKTVYPEKGTKKVAVDCSQVAGVNKKQTFGEFYGVFDDTFTNKDAYTGVQPSGDISDLHVNVDTIEEKSDTTSPGLYGAFKQVEDGYSIVLFGYGLSGSGKTYTLIGEQSKNVPGLLHYGLANLQGVSTIRVKYIFEQYIHEFTPTLNNISGYIYKLIDDKNSPISGIVKPLLLDPNRTTNFLQDEVTEFSNYINGQVDINDIKVTNINTLTSLLENYRKTKKRIKATPNNPVSSRSHLYLVFEITFDSGKIGYVTIVDTAGRESPKDIFNMYIEPSKRVTLETVLPPGNPEQGIQAIIDFMRPELKVQYQEEYYKKQSESGEIVKPKTGIPIKKASDFTKKTPKKGSEDPLREAATNIYNILKEGFYINETINHLIYFFNKKNFKEMTDAEIKKKMVKGLSSYEDTKYYVNPKEEENKLVEKNNCLMVPVLNFLDKISKSKQGVTEYKPTKFITMVCVRQDQQYCSQIFGSLDFAQNIKSS
jgi:hypothetical protein